MTASLMLLQLATAAWRILCGGVVYQHLAVVPQWASQPPASLAMWAGPYGLKAKRFWIGIHSVLVALLGAALATGWHASYLTSLLIVLSGYPAILAIRQLVRAGAPAPHPRSAGGAPAGRVAFARPPLGAAAHRARGRDRRFFVHTASCAQSRLSAAGLRFLRRGKSI